MAKGHSRSATASRREFIARVAAASVVIGCLTSTLSAPARADDLDDQQAALQEQLAASGSAIEGFSADLTAATNAVAESRQALADARAALAKAESERQAAAEVDAQRASELASAEQALTDAKTRVSDGHASVAEQQAKAVADLRHAHQQNTAMLSIGMFFVDGEDAGDVGNKIQWAVTLYNANSAEINRLTELQLQLQSDQDNMAGLEDAARVARENAAAQLSARQAAEAAAEDAANKVSDLVAQNEAAEARAAELLSNEQAAYEARQSEMEDVTQRIQERNARLAAEAAARAAAEEAARIAAEEAVRIAGAAADAQQAVDPAPAAPAEPAAPSSGFPLAMPAIGPYTSPFGYRTNPVLGYSELHDGLDIGSACGTPLYAAADGVVTEMYYGGGWGWRLIIDNGWIDGVQVSTGYNHAQGYVVGPGEWVSRGQVVGYTGTTGLSTGCHLHFHVWINGQVSDPAGYL